MTRLFVNTLTAYGKYSVINKEYLTHPIHVQFSQKQKTLSEFFSEFLISKLNFDHIQTKKKKIRLISNVFPNLRTSKNFVR